MLVELPVPYTVRLQRTGRQAVVEHELYAMMPFRLRELTGGQAPLAIQARTYPLSLSCNRPLYSETRIRRRPTDYRLSPEGMLMRELAMPGHPKTTAEDLQQSIAALCAQRNTEDLYTNPFDTDCTPRHWVAAASVQDEVRNAGRVTSDLESRYRAMVSLYQRGGGVVDGVVCVPSGGPLVLPMLGYRDYSIFVGDEFSHVGQSEWGCAYGADGGAQAMALLAQTAARRGFADLAEETAPDINLVLDGCGLPDSTVVGARGMCAALYEQGVQWRQLHKLSPDAMRAYATAREYMQDPHPPAGNIDALVEMMTPLRDQMAAQVRTHLGGPVWRNQIRTDPVELMQRRLDIEVQHGLQAQPAPRLP